MNLLCSLLFACTPKETTTIHTVVPKSVVPSTKEIPQHLRTQWPYTTWKTAKAYTFNHKEFGPHAELYAFREGTWNTSIIQEKPLQTQHVEQALEMNHRLGGTVIVSKCAFPRHAVVLFDAQEKPIASINICFSCGDILVWPPYSTDSTWEETRYAQRTEDGMPLIYAAQEELLPLWEHLLIQDVGLKPYVDAH